MSICKHSMTSSIIDELNYCNNCGIIELSNGVQSIKYKLAQQNEDPIELNLYLQNSLIKRKSELKENFYKTIRVKLIKILKEFKSIYNASLETLFLSIELLDSLFLNFNEITTTKQRILLASGCFSLACTINLIRQIQ